MYKQQRNQTKIAHKPCLNDCFLYFFDLGAASMPALLRRHKGKRYSSIQLANVAVPVKPYGCGKLAQVSQPSSTISLALEDIWGLMQWSAWWWVEHLMMSGERLMMSGWSPWWWVAGALDDECRGICTFGVICECVCMIFACFRWRRCHGEFAVKNCFVISSSS